MKSQSVPAEFKKVARNISTGVFDLVRTEEEFVAHALIGVDQSDAQVLRSYIAEIIAPENRDDELLELWAALPSGAYFNDGEKLRLFLHAVLRAVQQEPYLNE